MSQKNKSGSSDKSNEVTEGEVEGLAKVEESAINLTDNSTTLYVEQAIKYSEDELFPEVVEILQRTAKDESATSENHYSDDIKEDNNDSGRDEEVSKKETMPDIKDNDPLHQKVQETEVTEEPLDIESTKPPEGEEAEKYLEEKYYEPTVMSKEGFSVGEVINLGDKDFTIDEVLARAYYKAHMEGAEEDTYVLVSTKPRSPLWQGLPPQRLLPEVIYEGDDGYVLTWIEGELLEPKLPWNVVLEHLSPIAQLLRFFAAQDIAVVDINPNGLILTEQGLKLRYPLQIAKVGEDITLAPRDSFTPTEVIVNKIAGLKAGVYIWGAIFHYLYKGKPVPVEGIDPIEFSNIKEPGLPQIIYATLSPVHNRIDTATLQKRIKSLQRPPRPVFVVAAATTIGLAPERELNEDSYGFVQNNLETFEGPQQILRACVADGMGGEVAGELASRAAVQTFCEARPLPNLAKAEVQIDWTVNLVWRANDAVFDVLDDDGGGCTFTSISVVNDRLALAHVGDSRAYLYNPENGLQLLTRDHSLVRAMIDQGVITETEAESSPDANKVIRSLGVRRRQQEGDTYIDTLASLTDKNSQPIYKETRNVEPEEIILLLSDGIWGVWGYKEAMIKERLIKVIQANYTAQQVADNLVKAALEEGAPDNATAVVVKRLR